MTLWKYNEGIVYSYIYKLYTIMFNWKITKLKQLGEYYISKNEKNNNFTYWLINYTMISIKIFPKKMIDYASFVFFES